MNAQQQSDTRAEVHIRVARDADASRITGVLEALGYEVMRELDQGDGQARLEWAVERLARRHALTQRERDVLAGVLEGDDNKRLAQRLEISRATVKWHLHNVFTKTGVAGREALLRAALQLGPLSPATSPDDEHRAGPLDVTIDIE